MDFMGQRHKLGSVYCLRVIETYADKKVRDLRQLHLGCFSLCTRHNNCFQAAAMLPPLHNVLVQHQAKPLHLVVPWNSVEGGELHLLLTGVLLWWADIG